jgi:ribosomal protein S18 acetylase RimI-like enzyme
MSNDLDLLPNITWHTLSGPQSRFAIGERGARRYAAGFSPIIGFADPAQPDIDALAEICAPGESFYTDGWSGPAPDGWRIDVESTMFKMVWTGDIPAAGLADDAIALSAADVPKMLNLVAITKPGPFGPRTVELGDYLGIVDNGRLLAMAGERMQAGRLREISSVCTDPAAQGRGHARRLMLELVRRQIGRGQTPFLHVMRDNSGARRLYTAMGFRDERETVVRVLTRQ